MEEVPYSVRLEISERAYLAITDSVAGRLRMIIVSCTTPRVLGRLERDLLPCRRTSPMSFTRFYFKAMADTREDV